MSYPSRFVEFFGPSLWKSLQSIAFTFPNDATEEQRKDYIDFFKSVGPVIPCPSCANHYQQYINENPIDAENTDSLARWVYDLHDKVNKKNNKTSPTFEEIKNDYTGWNESEHQKLRTMTKSERERVLADPHLGRLNNSTTEKMSGMIDTKNISSFISSNYIFILAIIFLLFFVIYRKNKNEKEEKNKNLRSKK